MNTFLSSDTAYAYFAGGCFWCIAPIFRDSPGVLSATVGFSGGDEQDPTYEDVKSGKTHHRETIKVCYDPSLVTFENLLELFLWNIDPFDAEGQFIDRGKSYTLAVYYTSEAERQIVKDKLMLLKKESGKEPQITLAPFHSFYPATEEHQNFDLKNPYRYQSELQESGRNAYFKEKRHSSK